MIGFHAKVVLISFFCWAAAADDYVYGAACNTKDPALDECSSCHYPYKCKWSYPRNNTYIPKTKSPDYKCRCDESFD